MKILFFLTEYVVTAHCDSIPLRLELLSNIFLDRLVHAHINLFVKKRDWQFYVTVLIELNRENCFGDIY